ncbi:hypothetical protein GTHT12_01043 [Geobacillus thermodenitrificans]|jgi:hypothetical protein|nr:hypothetical protein GTHT12_01043 [Geobacillus thermodenitrificans]
MEAAHMERTSAKMIVYSMLFAIRLVHFSNNAMQAVIPALFPILCSTLKLSYTEISWIARKTRALVKRSEQSRLHCRILFITRLVLSFRFATFVVYAQERWRIISA